MAYSYGGWQDEFKDLTKENKFSGSAFEDNTDDKEEVVRPTKRPTGLGTKVVVADASGGEDDTSGNENDVYAVVKQMLGGNDSLVAPKASNLTTGKNTELYLAQQDNKIKKQLSYLKQINNINIQKDILNVDENEPTEVSIFRAVTAGRNLTTDASITSTLPNGDKLTIYDNAKVRNGAGNTLTNSIATGLGFEENVSGLQDFLTNIKDSFGNPIVVGGSSKFNELMSNQNVFEKPILPKLSDQNVFEKPVLPKSSDENIMTPLLNTTDGKAFNTIDAINEMYKPEKNIFVAPKTATEEFPGQNLLTKEEIDYNEPVVKGFSGEKPSVIEVLKEMYSTVTKGPNNSSVVDPEVKTFGTALADEDATRRLSTVFGEFRKNLEFEANLAYKPTDNPILNKVGILKRPDLSASKPEVKYTNPKPNAVVSTAGLGYNVATDTANLSAAGNIFGTNYGAAVDNRGEFGLQINKHLDSFNKPTIYGGFDTNQKDPKFNIGLEWSLGGK